MTKEEFINGLHRISDELSALVLTAHPDCSSASIIVGKINNEWTCDAIVSTNSTQPKEFDNVAAMAMHHSLSVSDLLRLQAQMERDNDQRLIAAGLKKGE